VRSATVTACGVVIAALFGACAAKQGKAGEPQPRQPASQQPGATQAPLQGAVSAGHYVGSLACAGCHKAIYERWKGTPMANVVRDPREHPDAILPDLSTNPFEPFDRATVALVYGSIWKQRYLTRVGDDYFVQPAQWDVTQRVWRRYFVANGTDWWAELYPPDNKQRPTGALCDGCHSVGYDVHTKKVVEWNVGCERCHGPGSEHAARPSAANVSNPARMTPLEATDVCVQCHSQGRPPANPIEGKYFDWPVGYRVGLRLADYWRLEDHRLGETTFTHFPDGTGHKNRMQGNDFVESVMYRHGVTCFNCHDVHGTPNRAQLREAGNAMCLGCHVPGGRNGPTAATVEEHTHHAKGSPGGDCAACHMPRIETTIADVRVRAHTFEIVTPRMTDQYKIPNPCNSCHTDRSTAWAAEAIARWPDRSPWRL
jgi:predicted CXXCH cytochrome family protein